VVKRALVALALLSCALWLFGQVVVEEVGAIQDAFAKAQQDMQAYRFPQAMQELDPVVKTLSGWEQSGRLQPSDETLLEKALELHGVASFNLGNIDAAKDDFTHLVRLRPDYALTATQAPKLLKLFEEVRGSLTGSVALSVQPPEAAVTVDGRNLGAPPPAQIPLLKGLHVIRASRPGYEAKEVEASVDVGSVKAVAITLVPNARTIDFFVQPQGSELTIDGRRGGSASQPASSRAEWAAFVADAGYSPSDYFVIEALNLAPGDHRVELSHSCYGQKRFLLNVVLDKENNRPGLIRPIALERKTLTFTLDSNPQGADVTLDGKSAGKTPLVIEDFCIGDHDLLLQKSQVGEYRARVAIPEGQAFHLTANLRPTIVWVGVTRDQETASDQAGAIGAALEAAMGKAANFNGVVAQENNPMLPDTFFAPGVDAAQVSSTVASLCSRYKAQGLLAGRVSRDGNGFKATFRLLLPQVKGFDEYSAQIESASAADAALAVVDSAPELGAWQYGFASFNGSAGPMVVRAPSGDGDLQPGDVLIAVDGTKVESPAEARKALAGKDKALAKLIRGGQEQTVALALRQAPAVVPYGGSDFGYRRLWLLARQEMLSEGDTTRGLVGRMNCALAALNLGLPSEASAPLEGISSGFYGPLRPASVAYLKGVDLLELGRLEEARAQLQQAAADEGAALDLGGEYLVAPLARDLLKQLPPPPPPPQATPPAGK
jgi:hypothetical protein